jgi:hypothetical protein
MEHGSRWRWISVVCFGCQIALKFSDENLRFFFRQVDEIALGQIRAAALKFGIFGEKLCHQLHHFRSRLGHAQLPGGRLVAIPHGTHVPDDASYDKVPARIAGYFN